jgi:hypothetical protein
MEKSLLIKWGIGITTMAIMGYVVYLFVVAPLPENLQPKHHIEAQVQLKRICELQKGYHKSHGIYASRLDSLGVFQAENDGATYWIEIMEADSSQMVARAYARVDFDEDGFQNVWEIGLDCLPRELQGD